MLWPGVFSFLSSMQSRVILTCGSTLVLHSVTFHIYIALTVISDPRWALNVQKLYCDLEFRRRITYVLEAKLPNPDGSISPLAAMNPERPRGTRRPRSRLTTDISPEISSSVLTKSLTTGHVIKKRRVVSSSDSTRTDPSIHQSGDHASIIFQAPYNDVRGDQYITNVGCKL